MLRHARDIRGGFLTAAQHLRRQAPGTRHEFKLLPALVHRLTKMSHVSHSSNNASSPAPSRARVKARRCKTWSVSQSV
jgi:hypothetical protein